MAKYTIISLILSDLCKYFLYSTCFKIIVGIIPIKNNPYVKKNPKLILGDVNKVMTPQGCTSIQAIAHFKRSWKILELKVVWLRFFLGSNKSTQPCYCTR